MSDKISYNIDDQGFETYVDFLYEESQEYGEEVAQLFFETIFNDLDIDHDGSVYRKNNRVYLEGKGLQRVEKLAEEYMPRLEEEVEENVR